MISNKNLEISSVIMKERREEGSENVNVDLD
jgi:hypothetical protein